MSVVKDGVQVPAQCCDTCNLPLLFFEVGYQWCYSCSTTFGVQRLCDRQRTNLFEVLGAFSTTEDGYWSNGRFIHGKETK